MPVARSSSVPKARGSATTSSIETPSTVTPTAHRSARSTTATTSGRRSNASITAAGSRAATTTRSSRHSSAQRLGSPAGDPPSARAMPSTSSWARSSSTTRCRRSDGRSRRASSRASVFGPIPGIVRRRPARAATTNSCTVDTPSWSAISSMRRAPTPRRRPSATSSGRTARSSSSSSAMLPVSASSRRRASIPGPIPRSSRARPSSASAATDVPVARIVSAARR